MKYFSILMLLSSFTAYAQLDTSVSPIRPVSCDQRGVKEINYISNTRTFENSQMVELTFLTYYGVCQNKKFQIKNLSPYMDLGIAKYGVRLPWQSTYKPEVTTELLNDKVSKVTIRFNKEKVFVKSQTAIYRMTIYPTSKFKFAWNVNLKYDSEQDKTKFLIKK